nr:MAG TPA: hypothetical protein [Caudoviricetes sp.]
MNNRETPYSHFYQAFCGVANHSDMVTRKWIGQSCGIKQPQRLPNSAYLVMV